VNKNIYSQFFWIKDCIKYCFTKHQEIITGFISNTKQYIYMNEQICVQIVKNPEAHPPVQLSTLILQLQAFTHSLRGNTKDVLLKQL